MTLRTHTTNCAGHRCPEQQHVDYTTDTELAAIQGLKWRCSRHRTPRSTEPVADTTTERTVNCADIELNNGENLKALYVGDVLELDQPAAGLPAGSWRVIEFHGEFLDRATLRNTSTEETHPE